MAYGTFAPPQNNLAAAGNLFSVANSPTGSDPGNMGLRILQAAIAQRGKAGAPATPAATSMAQPGLLQGLFAKLGIGQPGAAPAGGAPAAPAGGNFFMRNAAMPMRDPNATWTGGGPAAPQPNPGVPLPPPRPMQAAPVVPLPPQRPPQPPVVDAGTPVPGGVGGVSPVATALSGLW